MVIYHELNTVLKLKKSIGLPLYVLRYLSLTWESLMMVAQNVRYIQTHLALISATALNVSVFYNSLTCKFCKKLHHSKRSTSLLYLFILKWHDWEHELWGQLLALTLLSVWLYLIWHFLAFLPRYMKD